MSASFCYFAKRMPQACPLHTPLIMKRSYTYLLPAVVLCLMPACGGKKSDTQTANADSVMTTRTTAIAADPHWKSEKQVNWNGQTYQIRIERTPARDLPVITDELGQQFYDNRVELTITTKCSARKPLLIFCPTTTLKPAYCKEWRMMTLTRTARDCDLAHK